ncbi:MucBP domain-containing protein [Miniphocaeibacter massiliensis]|uniref:MucBP domain-containing protein n=1 Tax=Miniphocaeibacter massiliensis TaxID=2041841 RepID=UPI000C081110|nr:MucBP domain-containing protein [Miniphocaeibacter massiliensis]
MKLIKTKKVLSLICAGALIWGSTFSDVVSANETEEVPPVTTEEAEATDAPTEAPAKETEASTEETEAPAKETEASTEETEAPAKETEASTEETDKTTVMFNYIVQKEDGSLVNAYEIGKSGVVGEKLTFFVEPTEVEIISVKGGDFAYNSANNTITGTVSKDLQVDIVVKLLKAPRITAIIKFVDEEGNPVIGAPGIREYGEAGEVKDFKAPKVAGYKYTGPETITMPDKDGDTITLTYERIPLTLTVVYVDENGKTLKTSDSFDGKIGDTGMLKLPPIKGYKYIGKEGTASTTPGYEVEIPYTFGSSDDTYTAVYAPSTGKTTSNEKTKLEPEKKETKKKETEKKLPKTGTTENYMSIIGVGILVAGAILYTTKKEA